MAPFSNTSPIPNSTAMETFQYRMLKLMEFAIRLPSVGTFDGGNNNAPLATTNFVLAPAYQTIRALAAKRLKWREEFDDPFYDTHFKKFMLYYTGIPDGQIPSVISGGVSTSGFNPLSLVPAFDLYFFAKYNDLDVGFKAGVGLNQVMVVNITLPYYQVPQSDSDTTNVLSLSYPPDPLSQNGTAVLATVFSGNISQTVNTNSSTGILPAVVPVSLLDSWGAVKYAADVISDPLSVRVSIDTDGMEGGLYYLHIHNLTFPIYLDKHNEAKGNQFLFRILVPSRSYNNLLSSSPKRWEHVGIIFMAGP